MEIPIPANEALLLFAEELLELAPMLPAVEPELPGIAIELLTATELASANILNEAAMDAPEEWGMNFQDPATHVSRGIQNLHNDIMFFIIVIAIFTFWMLARSISHFTASQKPARNTHGVTLEVIWTVVPSLILLVLVTPSLALLYAMDTLDDHQVSVKVTGNQWYWNYELSDASIDSDTQINFDSYMIPEDDLEEGQLRLLEVDNRLVLPVDTHIRILVTARDVIHNWSVPSLAMKCDGLPGRLNQANLTIDREGLFFGQCSELCGVHHGFMPIVVEAVPLEDYYLWIDGQIDAPETESVEVEESSDEI